jgi:U4/U6.U5 tri-snRNP-associated protein 1
MCYSAVPQLSEFLDSQPLTKGANAEKKGKKKKENKTAAPQIVDMTGFTALPTVQSGLTPLSGSASASPAPVAVNGGSPAPKPGFSRIVSESSPAPGSGLGTPATPATPVPTNGERTKVAFGFGTKRKAPGDDLAGSPPTKKR